MVNIGLIYSKKGDSNNAVKCHQEALKIDKEIGYRQGEAADFGNIGLIYSKKGDLDNALKYLNEALNILKKYNLMYSRNIIQDSINSIKKQKA